jgi:DUF971 family protein
MNKNTPSGITADRAKRLFIISWVDGISSEIPFSLLRKACPCAQCRGGHENMSKSPDPDVFLIPLSDGKENEITDVQPVGNYGITVAWGDGHKFGIYTWDYLRELGDGLKAKSEEG